MQDFKNLMVWKKSMELVLSVYKNTSLFPSEERYNLTSQTRRAVVSISNNIAEGSARYTSKDFANFLQISLGSTVEVENCFLISKELGYLSDVDFNKINTQIIEIRKMLISLITKVRNVSTTPQI